MDPASLALSVATVLETAIKLVEILHDIKEGGKQRIRLSAEISSLWLVLENVKNQLDELSTSASQVPTSYLRSLSLPDGPLSQCSELLNTLYEKCTPKTGPSRVLQTLKWSFDKDEVDRYLLIVQIADVDQSFHRPDIAGCSQQCCCGYFSDPARVRESPAAAAS
jgi:hypothetical protein